MIYCYNIFANSNSIIYNLTHTQNDLNPLLPIGGFRNLLCFLIMIIFAFRIMLLAFMYYVDEQLNTHFAELRITLPPPGHVWWVLKGHIKGHKATNCSTCAVLFQHIRNVSVKSEALPSCFVTNTTSFQHWHYFISIPSAHVNSAWLSLCE